jgi:hypothetical protein
LTATRLALVAATAAALALTGCGVTSEDRSFDPKLVNEVGAGSQALKRIETALLQVRNQAQNTAGDAAAGKLLRGDLAAVTPADLAKIEAGNLDSRRHFDALLTKFDSIPGDLDSDRVDAAEFDSLSPGGKRFIRTWNAYLHVNARNARGLRTTLADLRPAFGDMTALVAAARAGDRGRFEQVRRATLTDIGKRADRFKRKAARLFANTDTEKRFADLVNNNQEAQAIVTAVNDKYPDGYLADAVKKR